MASHRDFVEPEIADQMNKIGHMIGDALPKGYGFALLIFGMEELEGYMNYMSNANREDMVAALKELIANFEGRGHEPPRSKQ